MKEAAILLILVLASSAVCAWGPDVNKHVCETAIRKVWGDGVVSECIPKKDSKFLQNFCEVNALVMGTENYVKCKQTLSRDYGTHPAIIPEEVFHDDELHYDYSHCPIIKGSERWWICGDKEERPTIDLAEKWFNAAETAPDLCTRVYDFCIASNYYADSESELHQVKGYYNDCQKIIEDTADNLIKNNLSTWSAGYVCRFREGKGNSLKDYRERLGVGSNDVERALAYLYARGESIKNMSLKPKNSVIILANSIDRELAQGLYDFLGNNSVDVHFSSAEEFGELRYNPRVVVLGGHNAPEGVGEVVSTVMLREEKDSLMVAGAKMMVVRDGVWEEGQKVVLVAGNEKEDTRDVWADNLEMILTEVRM